MGISKNHATPKMDGENNGSGKPYEQMDDLGVLHPYFWKHPYRYPWDPWDSYFTIRIN